MRKDSTTKKLFGMDGRPWSHDKAWVRQSSSNEYSSNICQKQVWPSSSMK